MIRQLEISVLEKEKEESRLKDELKDGSKPILEENLG